MQHPLKGTLNDWVRALIWSGWKRNVKDKIQTGSWGILEVEVRKSRVTTSSCIKTVSFTWMVTAAGKGTVVSRAAIRASIPFPVWGRGLRRRGSSSPACKPRSIILGQNRKVPSFLFCHCNLVETAQDRVRRLGSPLSPDSKAQWTLHIPEFQYSLSGTSPGSPLLVNSSLHSHRAVVRRGT